MTRKLTLALMRRIDELHLQYPFAGARMLRDLLRQEGHRIGRRRVASLMRRMGIWGIDFVMGLATGKRIKPAYVGGHLTRFEPWCG